jgi:hypothetical protein
MLQLEGLRQLNRIQCPSILMKTRVGIPTPEVTRVSLNNIHFSHIDGT